MGDEEGRVHNCRTSRTPVGDNDHKTSNTSMRQWIEIVYIKVLNTRNDKSMRKTFP